VLDSSRKKTATECPFTDRYASRPAMKVGITERVYNLGELLALPKRTSSAGFKGTGIQSVAPSNQTQGGKRVKRFIVGTNGTTPEQDSTFLTLVKAHWPDIGWWHRLGGTWLFVDPNDLMVDAVELRDIAKEAFPYVNLVVFDIPEGSTWAGFGVGQDFAWIHSWWE